MIRSFPSAAEMFAGINPQNTKGTQPFLNMSGGELTLH